jgi:hypothetical protein
MRNSWKQFWVSEESIVISLCIVGILIGLITGNTIARWVEYFPVIEMFNKYQIPTLISFGMIVALATQIVSVLLSWVMLARGNESHWDKVSWLSIGLPMGILIALNIFNGYLAALGFVIPYILDILLTWIVMIFVGWRTMHILWFNAISLLPLYLVSTGIIWLFNIASSMSRL